LELGHLTLPSGADVAAFILSDGRVDQQPKPAARSSTTLNALLDAYLESIPTGALEATTDHCIRVHVRHFKRVFGEKFRVDEMTLEALQKYVDVRAAAKGLRGKSLSPTTVKKELGTLGMVWSWAANHKYIYAPLPKKGLRLPKTSDKPPFQTMAEVKRKTNLGGLTEEEVNDLWDAVFLTLSEIDELLHHVKQRAQQPALYPMFVFAAHTGARRSEIRRSCLDDLDFDGKRIFIRERKRVRGRHTLRSVPMSPMLEEVLKDWLEKHPGGRFTFRFRMDDPARPSDAISDEEAGYYFERVTLGTKWEKLRGWHMFRHSFCSNCAARGIDQRMINSWVGHQTEDMVRRYRHLIPNQEHEAIQSVFAMAPPAA